MSEELPTCRCKRLRALQPAAFAIGKGMPWEVNQLTPLQAVLEVAEQLPRKRTARYVSGLR